MTMDFEHFTAISFDCYGTLIDWEAGILLVLRALLASHGQSLTDAAILELYGEFEAEAESGPYQSYRDVLQSVVRAFADRFHFKASSAPCTNRCQRGCLFRIRCPRCASCSSATRWW